MHINLFFLLKLTIRYCTLTGEFRHGDNLYVKQSCSLCDVGRDQKKERFDMKTFFYTYSNAVSGARLAAIKKKAMRHLRLLAAMQMFIHKTLELKQTNKNYTFTSLVSDSDSFYAKQPGGRLQAIKKNTIAS